MCGKPISTARSVWPRKMKSGSYRAAPRTRSARGGISPEHSGENAVWSAGFLCRIFLQILACVASLVLGFRFSRESLFFAFHWSQPDGPYLNLASTEITNRINDSDVALQYPYVFHSEVAPQNHTLVDKETSEGSLPLNGTKSSRVHVGRHEILVRPWPHPDPLQMLVAHNLILRVQEEQMHLYGGRHRRRIIAITPTFSRTFQTAHLTGLRSTLSHIPDPLTWIVVEAGGQASTETVELLAKSDLEFVHLTPDVPLPSSWDEQAEVEARLRLDGLRYVRQKKLDGIVVFADESNSYSLEFFEEVHTVKWIGAVSVGILQEPRKLEEAASVDASSKFYPIQGPVCNSSGQLVGWHTVDHPLGSVTVGYTEPVDVFTARRSLEWAGFVINSEILLESRSKPRWLKDWDDWFSANGLVDSPTSIVRDEQLIEPLGDCGSRVLVWWLRAEARADSKHPHRWVIDPPLEVVVPSQRTPWPHPPPPPPPESYVPLHTRENSARVDKPRKQGGKDSKSKGRSRRDKKKHDQMRTEKHGSNGSAT